MSAPPELCLELHGPTAAAHELHTGRPGSHATAQEALRAARGRGQRVLVTTALTRSSCRSLVELGEQLVTAGVAGWAVAWPRVEAVPPAEVPRTVARLGIAVPHALRAVERVRRRMAVVLVGVPLCTLGPYAAHRLATPRGGGVYPAICEGCPARAGCPGVDGGYLDRFGAEELRAVPAVPRAELPAALVAGLRRATEEEAEEAEA